MHNEYFFCMINRSSTRQKKSDYLKLSTGLGNISYRIFKCLSCVLPLHVLMSGSRCFNGGAGSVSVLASIAFTPVDFHSMTAGRHA